MTDLNDIKTIAGQKTSSEEQPVPTDRLTGAPLATPDETNDRLTATLQVHLEHLGEDPVSTQAMFSVHTLQEEPFNRRFTIPAGGSLDLNDKSWVQNPGYYCIKNITGQNNQRLPTKEEVAANDSKIALMGVHQISPGKFFFGQKQAGKEFELITAEDGPVELRVVVYPV